MGHHIPLNPKHHLTMNLGPPASRRPVAIEAKNLAAGTAALPGIVRWFRGSMRELIRGILAPNIYGVGSHQTVKRFQT